jgi:hypothetical protein
MSDLPGNAIPIEALAEDARGLTPEGFEEKFGTGFLMVTAANLNGSRSVTGTELLLDDEGDVAGQTASLAVVVYPLRPRAETPGHLVMLGRDPSHDVVVPDPSVSRIHAFAKRESNGTFVVQDMGSSNGTTVNGQSVAPRGAGAATLLKPGDTLRMGQVEFTFTDARALREFAIQLAS